MKKYAKHIVKSGVPVVRRGNVISRRARKDDQREREKRNLQGVYAPLDSWEPEKRHADRKPRVKESPFGRPRMETSKKRSVPFSFLMSPEEWEIFDAHVKDLGCSASSFARQAVFQAMEKELPPRPLRKTPPKSRRKKEA